MAIPKKSPTPRYLKKRRIGRVGRNKTTILTGKRWLAEREAAQKVASKYLQAAETARASGTPVRLTIVIKPTGSVLDMAMEDITPVTDALDLALATARDRGSARVADILNGPEMMTADEVAREIKVSRETVNNKRKRHELLGLEGPKRGIRFPRWQFSESGELLLGLSQLFREIGDRPWAVYRFLIQHHDGLEGKTGLEAVRSGEMDLVADVVRSINEGAIA